MEAKVYNQEGTETGKIKLPDEVFGAPWNADLVHQVVVGMQANARTPVAHARDRSEQRGGGQKPWRQKGTGRARHGSRRSPIWRGGGVTHGPRKEKSYVKKINRKMRAKALYAVLSRKYRDGEILFVEGLHFDAPKATNAGAVLKTLSSIESFTELTKRKKNAALIALDVYDVNTKRSFANFGNVLVDETRNLNPVNVLQYKYLIVVNPNESITLLESRGSKD